MCSCEPPIAAAVVPRAPPAVVARRVPVQPVELGADHVTSAAPGIGGGWEGSQSIADKHAAWQASLRGVLEQSDACTRAMLAPATALNPLDTAMYLSKLKEEEVRLLDGAAQVQIREFRRRAKELVLSNPALRQIVEQQAEMKARTMGAPIGLRLNQAAVLSELAGAPRAAPPAEAD